jgi:threonine/homoserine/homoserine lactone efflux protein
MDTAWIAAVSGFAIAMAGTPGPNNAIAIASGANYGFRGTLPFISGVTIGVASIILVVGAVGTPIMAEPRIRTILKWAGILYLLWLAWRIGSARPPARDAGNKEETAGKPLTVVQGALFQLVNPKLWVMVAGAVVTYGSAAGNTGALAVATALGLIFGTATFASVVAWTLIGVGTGRLIRTERAMRLFNWTMAALLVLSLVPVLAE